MQYFLFAALIWTTSPLYAADGPQNTGTLTIEESDGKQIRGLLQIDRTAVTTVLGTDENSYGQTLSQLMQVRSGGSDCPHQVTGVTASEKVLALAIQFECTSNSTEVDVQLLNPNLLPEKFSLGVKAASGHFSLDLLTPSVRVIISRPCFYFELGRSYFYESQSSVAAGLNRQAALWFGGFHRLPFGTGTLLALIAIALMRVGWVWRSALGIIFMLISSTVATNILSRHGSQSVHAFLYSSHIYFCLVALLFCQPWLCRRIKPWIVVGGLVLLTAISHGFEHATVLWGLERIDATEIAPSVFAFYGGMAVGVLPWFISVWIFEKAVTGNYFNIPKAVGRWRTILAICGFVVSIYAMVGLLLRFRL